MNIPAEVLAALIGGLVVLAGQHFLKRKTDAEAENITVDTVGKMGEQIDRLETKVSALRDSVDVLEEKAHQFNELKEAVKDLMRWLDEHGVQGYPRPPEKLLETDPRMKAIRKGVK